MSGSAVQVTQWWALDGPLRNAWHEPKPRTHATDQLIPVKRWTPVCGACHDSTDATAHISI